MKFSILIFLVNCFVTTAAQEKIREKINFNDQWGFSLSDSNSYHVKDFNDKEWRKLNLPHDWSIESEFGKQNSGRNAWLPGGVGWYRKSFVLPNEYQGKHIEIQFDGIYKNSKIFVNNHPVGGKNDGYTSFSIDITELLIPGKNNTIAIKVDNSIQPNSRWYSGSGIYRNVWLTVSSPTHVATWGTYITTPTISASQAEVVVKTTMENLDKSKAIVLETNLYNPQGIKVAGIKTPVNLGNYRSQDIEQTIIVQSPQLWSVSTPQKYSAISRLIANDLVLDEYKSAFGIRSLRFDAEKGFFLNDENMKIKGVCLHHEAGVFGAAVPIEVWERRLTKLKEIGCNAIRTAHNPPAPEFLDLCDSLGFLVMDEFVDKWDNASENNPFFDEPFADPEFSNEWKQNFSETIKRDRNHPSIIIWSIGNENHAPGSNIENHGLRNYTSFVRTLDPTRPVVEGMERNKDIPVSQKVNDIIESCTYMDLIAMNYGEQWVKLIHERKPGKPFISTESYTYFNSSLEKRYANIERSPWLDVENDNNMGLFLWVGISYLGESGKWPNVGSNGGLFDNAGFKTCRSYLYEAFWSKKPMVAIEVYQGDANELSKQSQWGWPAMNQSWNLKKGDVKDLVTYTNCEAVDLYLNGKKIGHQLLADFPNWIMKWKKVAFESGTLRVVGLIDGKEVCSAELKTTDTPKSTLLNIDKKILAPQGVAQIEIQLLDAKGNKVVAEDKELQFTIEGPGDIIGLANGYMNTTFDVHNHSSLKTNDGKGLCVIRAGDQPGLLKIKVTAPEMKENLITIHVK